MDLIVILSNFFMYLALYAVGGCVTYIVMTQLSFFAQRKDPNYRALTHNELSVFAIGWPITSVLIIFFSLAKLYRTLDDYFAEDR